LVDKVRELAREKDCTPAQLALAWVLAQGEYIVPIPGTRRSRNLEENVGALEVQLDAEDLAVIEAVFPAGATAGERYPETMMRLSRGRVAGAPRVRRAPRPSGARGGRARLDPQRARLAAQPPLAGQDGRARPAPSAGRRARPGH